MKKTAAILLTLAIALTALLCAACARKDQVGVIDTEDSRDSIKLDAQDFHTKKDDSKSASKDTSSDSHKETAAPTETAKTKSTNYTIKSEDCFESSGFKWFRIARGGNISVKIDSGDTGVQWKVYLLDGEFDDDLRNIDGKFTPVLEGAGTISVKTGQYVYVYCSANASTADAPVTGAAITFNGKGLPKS
ncbi:MAG: hypothetical protein IJM18_01280 [Clostridia bacterium]|nr:hypothetical protein [Clostridia bacterium]